MSGYSKFSAQTKVAIRQAVAMGTPVGNLAQEHDVTPRTIHRIIRGHIAPSTKTAIVVCKCGTTGERFRKVKYVREYVCSDCQNKRAAARDAKKHKDRKDDGCSEAKLRSVGLRPEPKPKKCRYCKGTGTWDCGRGRETCGACRGWGHLRPEVKYASNR